MKRSKVYPAATALVAASCLLGVGLATSAPSLGPGLRGHTGGARLPGARLPEARLAGADLVAFTSCAQVLRQVKAEAMKEVGPYGIPAPAQSYGEDGYGQVVGQGFAGRVPVLMPEVAEMAAGTGRGVPGPVEAAPATAGGLGAPAGQEASVTPGDGSGASTPPVYSTTNDQEAGADEPDMVKTNGQVMVVLRQEPVGVQVVDVSGAAPALDGFIPLPQLADAEGLFLVGSDVVVIGGGISGYEPPSGGSGTGAGGAPVPTTVPKTPPGVVPLLRTGPAQEPVAQFRLGPAQVRPAVVQPLPAIYPSPATTTKVVVISVADPQTPAIVRTFSFSGQDQGARLINGQVVLALTNQPRLRWVYPAGPSPAALRAATAANRALVASSVAADWLPTAVVGEPGRGATTSGSPASCPGSTYRTTVSTGVGTVSVVSFDPTQDAPGQEVTVVGNAEDVYASATQIYVATTNWRYPIYPPCPPRPGTACPLTPAYIVAPEPGTGTTDIYGFDISNPQDITYLGAGDVPGALVGQYAMSEANGYLRVASSVGEPTPAPIDGEPAPVEQSDNEITVLQPEDGTLAKVGSLTGLGRGEKIYAVRFLGDLAYVVTYNQMDPLFVVNLSNPEQPVLAGQLTLSGYSSLLQPLSPGLLLGVGQAVDQKLSTQGLQVEVFDVADPSQPSLVSRQQLGGGSGSAAESDPHALLWWPAANLLVVPVDNYAGTGPTSVADVWSVSPAGTMEQLGSLSQPAGSTYGSPQIERAVVVGGNLYTLSEQGVMANAVSSLAPVAWLAYPSSSS